MSIWNPAAIELLRRYWSEGLKASQIAERLIRSGVAPTLTRNAVIGKLNRMRLSATDVKSARDRLSLLNSASLRRRKTNKIKASAEKVRAPKIVDLPREALPPVAVDDVPRLSFQELNEHRDCKYPVNHVGDSNFGFCGNPRIPGSSYCAGHHQRCSRDYSQIKEGRNQGPARVYASRILEAEEA